MLDLKFSIEAFLELLKSCNIKAFGQASNLASTTFHFTNGNESAFRIGDEPARGLHGLHDSDNSLCLLNLVCKYVLYVGQGRFVIRKRSFPKSNNKFKPIDIISFVAKTTNNTFNIS